MFKWVYRLLVAMAIASTAQASVVVELVPDNPGPYYGGESLTVDVWLHSGVSFDALLSLIQFDFTDTDPALALDSVFAFDFSSIPGDYNPYEDPGFGFLFPELPVPRTGDFYDCYCPDLYLRIPADGLLHIGSIGMQLPTAPGLYRVDALNRDEADAAQGARLIVRPTNDWRAYTGEITGGAYDFAVIPEPATLVLVAFGVLTLRWTLGLCYNSGQASLTFTSQSQGGALCLSGFTDSWL